MSIKHQASKPIVSVTLHTKCPPIRKQEPFNIPRDFREEQLKVLSKLSNSEIMDIENEIKG